MRLDSNDMRERVKDTLMETLSMALIETDEDTVEATMPVTPALVKRWEYYMEVLLYL